MPWCPNCKTEYREGIEKCADCGSTLVKSLNEEDRVEASCSLLIGDAKHVRMIEEHLHSEGFSSAFCAPKNPVKGESLQENTKEKLELFVSAEEREEAVKCAAEFMRNTNPQAIEAANNPESPRVVTKKSAPSKEYKTAAERKNDLKSSGIMLLCFGVAGLLFMVLIIFGIVPIRFNGFSAVIAYTILGGFFGTLFVSGIVSLKNAKEMGAANDEEKERMNTVNAWCDENLSKEMIEARIPGDVSEDEQLYFERFDFMKHTLASAFPDLKDDFLEYYTEQLYSKYFE